MASQQSILASAFHDLRSSFATYPNGYRVPHHHRVPELRDRIANDIIELDDLIDELLFASHLDSVESQNHTATMDVPALAAEEGARVNVSVSGQSARIPGIPQLLGK